MSLKAEIANISFFRGEFNEYHTALSNPPCYEIGKSKYTSPWPPYLKRSMLGFASLGATFK